MAFYNVKFAATDKIKYVNEISEKNMASVIIVMSLDCALTCLDIRVNYIYIATTRLFSMKRKKTNSLS